MQKTIPFFVVISLSALVVLSCTDRESASPEETIPLDGESYAFISLYPDDPFLSDSLDIVIDATTSANLFIFSFDAYERPENGNDRLSFTAFGIPMPGTKIFDHQSIYGVASYYDSDAGKTYVSTAIGGEGNIEVTEFVEPYDSVSGAFNLVLIDTLSGQMITVNEGFFKTAVDTLE